MKIRLLLFVVLWAPVVQTQIDNFAPTNDPAQIVFHRLQMHARASRSHYLVPPQDQPPSSPRSRQSPQCSCRLCRDKQSSSRVQFAWSQDCQEIDRSQAVHYLPRLAVRPEPLMRQRVRTKIDPQLHLRLRITVAGDENNIVSNGHAIAMHDRARSAPSPAGESSSTVLCVDSIQERTSKHI